MTGMAADTALREGAPRADAPEAWSEPVFRKNVRRLIPILLASLLFVSLDRINVAYARLGMARELGLGDAAFGFGAGIFFLTYASLARSGDGSVQQMQQTTSLLLQRTAGVQQARAALTAAEQQVHVLEAAEQKAKAQLEHFRAAEQQARLNLGYTVITAPIDGTIGARTLRVGQYVQAGTLLMAVVPLDAVYIVANFKETQLTRVKPGQTVSIDVDSFPDASIKGRVDSIAPASGLQFSLLPPDNATGNFTKIVQRLPIKIVLDRGSAGAGLLRPGMSVEPVIDTRGSGDVAK